MDIHSALLRLPPRILPANILPDRRHAHAALRRMFARSRRYAVPMMLVRLRLPPASAELPRRIFLSKFGGDLRVTDLAWWDEEAGALLVMIEESQDVAPLLERWAALASALRLEVQLAPVQFPRQGATLNALLEALE